MMKTIQVASAVALALSSVSFAQQAVQWKVSEGGNGHWYSILTGANCQQGFQMMASQRGGHLVSIMSSEENQFVHAIINGSTGFWTYIGFAQDPSGSEPSSGWRWLSGEPVLYVGWGANEPNNGGTTGQDEDSAIMFPGLSYWVDAGACVTDQAIIEWSADCNGDGIVDYGQCRDGSLPDYNGNNIPDCCEAGTPCVVGNYPVQWRAEDGGNGHWYDQHVWTGPATALQINGWVVANRGAHMVTLNAASEDAFVYERLNLRPAGSLPPAYSILGGYQDTSAPDYSEPSGGWRWVTGEPMQYTNWGPGLPDNVAPGESVLQYPGAAIWNDAETSIVPAGHRFRVIIEWSADCNNDGTVDYGQIRRGQLADANADGVPDICQQPTCHDADVYTNGRIDGADLAALLSEWGPVTSTTRSDFDDNGQVNGADLAFLLSVWGSCP